MRPAEVCGCVSRPRRSSSASSPRTVEVETSRPLRSTSVREPTGSRVATYSSTTRRRIVPWRSVSSTTFMAFAGTLREQLGGDAAAEVAAALGEHQLARPALDEAEARWPLARGEGREVDREPRRRPPAHTGDRRDGADAEAQVVAAVPVGEVVPRAQVAGVGAAEVRGLVPAVAGAGERRDDALEIGLQRVGLPRELLAVGVREARARLRLELVAGEVLRLERERLGEVGLEVGGALAGDAVDQVERDVLEAGRAQSAHG